MIELADRPCLTFVPSSACASPAGDAYVVPGRSPSQVAWICPIIPVFVNIWLLFTRSTWWRWQGLQPSSQRPAKDGFAIP